MKIEFIAGVAVITADPSTSRRLCVDALAPPLEGQNEYIHSEDIGGGKHISAGGTLRRRRGA